MVLTETISLTPKGDAHPKGSALCPGYYYYPVANLGRSCAIVRWLSPYVYGRFNVALRTQMTCLLFIDGSEYVWRWLL